mmetsp:Transcript_24681/g.56711  ORF Transcript_24681/g.56711 Transcript_24681/m.56711 type:complete len:838 (+) Transcript_24681:661-3174(+)
MRITEILPPSRRIPRQLRQFVRILHRRRQLDRSRPVVVIVTHGPGQLLQTAASQSGVPHRDDEPAGLGGAVGRCGTVDVKGHVVVSLQGANEGSGGHHLLAVDGDEFGVDAFLADNVGQRHRRGEAALSRNVIPAQGPSHRRDFLFGGLLDGFGAHAVAPDDAGLGVDLEDAQGFAHGPFQHLVEFELHAALALFRFGVDLHLIVVIVGADQLHDHRRHGGLGHLFVLDGIVTARGVVDVDADHDRGHGQTFGNVHPPDADSTFTENLSGHAAQNHGAALGFAIVAVNFSVVEGVEIDKLGQVSSLSQDLFDDGIGLIVRLSIFGFEKVQKEGIVLDLGGGEITGDGVPVILHISRLDFDKVGRFEPIFGPESVDHFTDSFEDVLHVHPQTAMIDEHHVEFHGLSRGNLEIGLGGGLRPEFLHVIVVGQGHPRDLDEGQGNHFDGHENGLVLDGESDGGQQSPAHLAGGLRAGNEKVFDDLHGFRALFGFERGEEGELHLDLRIEFVAADQFRGEVDIVAGASDDGDHGFGGGIFQFDPLFFLEVFGVAHALALDHEGGGGVGEVEIFDGVAAFVVGGDDHLGLPVFLGVEFVLAGPLYVGGVVRLVAARFGVFDQGVEETLGAHHFGAQIYRQRHFQLVVAGMGPEQSEIARIGAKEFDAITSSGAFVHGFLETARIDILPSPSGHPFVHRSIDGPIDIPHKDLRLRGRGFFPPSVPVGRRASLLPTVLQETLRIDEGTTGTRSTPKFHLGGSPRRGHVAALQLVRRGIGLHGDHLQLISHLPRARGGILRSSPENDGKVGAPEAFDRFGRITRRTVEKNGPFDHLDLFLRLPQLR